MVYLAQVFTGVNWLAPSTASMLGWGGNLAAYSLTDQPWRLLTSMFLHVGLVHLALNMYMLLAFGTWSSAASAMSAPCWCTCCRAWLAAWSAHCGMSIRSTKSSARALRAR